MYPNDPNTPGPDGMPPVAPRKRHHYIRWTLAGLGALILAVVVISVAAGGSGTKNSATPVNTSTAATWGSAPATQAAVPAAAAPSPDGTFTGACDYTLGSNPAGGTAVATGDIEAASTGNIGITVRLTITWPQQGYSPLSETKTARVPAGGSQDVQFNRPLTSDQLDNLQNWQIGHAGDTGCTYDGTITGTYGTVAP